MTNDPIQSEVRYVELHGDRIAYRESGSGEVLRLIHGMGGSSESWRPVFNSLASKYRVVAPDLLGHGMSDKPRTDYSLGAFAAGLRDLLEQLGINEVTVVGHSLGGGVAMQFIYQHPEYCQRMILISSGGLGADVGAILRLLSAPGAEFVLPFIAPGPVLGIGRAMGGWLEARGISSALASEIWKTYSSFAEPATRRAFLRTLRSVVDYRGQMVSALNRLHIRADVPTLLIWGDTDRIIPVDHGYAAQAARSGSRLEILPAVGHFPQIEAPTEVIDIINSFVAETSNDVPDRALAAMKDKDGERHSPKSAAAQLKSLLDRRTAIDRAIGMLGSHAGVNSQDALVQLQLLSHDDDITLDEAAERYIRRTVRDATRC